MSNNFRNANSSFSSYYETKRSGKNRDNSWNNSYQTYSPMGSSYQSASPMNHQSPWNRRSSYHNNSNNQSFTSYGHNSDRDSSSFYQSADSFPNSDYSSFTYNSSYQRNRHSNSYRGKSVIARSIEDPWMNLKPKRSLEDGERLAPAPPSQRATELFSFTPRKRNSIDSPQVAKKREFTSPPSPSKLPYPDFVK